jgi:Thrombospondin type 3 repeat
LEDDGLSFSSDPSIYRSLGTQPTADNTGTGRNAVLDVVSFPASAGGGTDADGDGVPEPPDNCPNVYNPQQRDGDGDGVGNACDGTTPTDTDNDGVIDAEDQCDTQPGPAPTGCPTDPGGGTSWNCTANQITPGEDLDAIINNDSSGAATRFCVHAGTYQVSAQATLKAGDKLEGEPENKTYIDTATKPTPAVKLVGGTSDPLLRADGNGISITWVDLSGASGTVTGTGAIAAGSAGSDFLVQFARIHNNASLGISNMKGRVLDSEFFSNSESSTSLGFNASAVKGITEFEVGRVYVHDEQGNGLWCDVGCSNDPAGTNGFWVYDSVVVNSNRAGIRYENSPNQALFENNELHGNGRTERRGGIDIRDSQNARVINNNLGPATIAGVSYAANGDRVGVRATDSGRSDRVNLTNVDVVNNKMNGDSIITCGGPVSCSGNTNVGTR